MSRAIDFAEVKSKVSIEKAIPLLGLSMKRSGDHFRGPCPICNEGGARALAITVSKNVFYCFGHAKGGDIIALVAETKKISMKEAAMLIAEHEGLLSPTAPQSQARDSSSPVVAPSAVSPPVGFKPLDYLVADHEALANIGVSPETLKSFGAGFAPKGILRGRLAIPIHDREGILRAYCGRSLNGEQPTLIFPKDFNPEDFIFNAHRVEEGDLQLVRDPIHVLSATEAGMTNVVAYLTESATPQQLEQLASLMDERKCERVEWS